MNEIENLVKERIQESIQVKELLLQGEQIKIITNIGEIIGNAYKKGRKVILFGNGGSAADAQHIAAELVGRYYINRKSLPAIALTTNTSSLTAIGNDYSFDTIFARQIEGIGEAGDIAIGISTSGKSKNVLLALKIAKEKKLITIGFTGKQGTMLKEIVDHCVCIPSNDVSRIQECHIMIGHIICEIVEKELFTYDEERKT